MAEARPVRPAIAKPPLRANITGAAREDKVRREMNADLAKVLTCPLLNGQLIEGVVLRLGQDTVINHALKRQARGYLITRRRAESGAVFDREMTATSITLHSSSNATVDLWVF